MTPLIYLAAMRESRKVEQTVEIVCLNVMSGVPIFSFMGLKERLVCGQLRGASRSISLRIVTAFITSLTVTAATTLLTIIDEIMMRWPPNFRHFIVSVVNIVQIMVYMTTDTPRIFAYLIVAANFTAFYGLVREFIESKLIRFAVSFDEEIVEPE